MLQNAQPYSPAVQKALTTIKERGGIVRTAQALKAGIHPATLYAMRDSGALESLSRGVYRLADSPNISNPDLLTVAIRIPKGVLCLISALSYHEITTQIPHEVHVALPSGAEEPCLDFPPIRTYHFGGESYSEGMEVHQIDTTQMKIYSVEKTLADCFKFRNRMGMDTVVEALKLCRERKNLDIDQLMHYARVCRVHKVMRPYLEAIF